MSHYMSGQYIPDWGQSKNWKSGLREMGFDEARIDRFMLSWGILLSPPPVRTLIRDLKRRAPKRNYPAK